jgi:uncharacterized repeat protein (TIGR01451 family)
MVAIGEQRVGCRRALLLCIVGWLLCCHSPLAAAAAVVQTQSFNFSHSDSISTGLVSIGGTFTNTQATSAPALSFTQFNPALGQLTGVTVATSTSTATYQVAVTGVIGLITSASATRVISYTATAGGTNGGDSNSVVNSGSSFVTALASSPAVIGGATIAKSTPFTATTDLANFTGSGSVAVTVTATDTLSETVLVSAVFGAGLNGTGTSAGNVTVTYTYTPWQVSGYVYSDLNHNGFHDGSEAGTGLTLYAKLLNDSSPSGPALQAVTVDPTTGLYTFSVTPTGLYRILIDDNATLSDVTPLVPPGGWEITQPSGLIRTGIWIQADINGLDFGLAPGTGVRGRVFKDNGIGSGTANDGIINGAEDGIGNQTVQLLDASSNVLDTQVTPTDGTYYLLVPSATANAATLKVVLASHPLTISTGASVGTTAGTYTRTSDTISFSYTRYTACTGVNFGEVTPPTLAANATQNGVRSAALYYTHKFIAQSAGTVSFTTSTVATPTSPTWSATLYLDANGNGVIDAGETPIAGSVAVTTGQTLSLILKVTVPAAAPANASLQATLQATMTFTNAPSPTLTTLVSVVDTTGIQPSTTGALTLVKSVDKSTAKPGNTIVYTIVFTNTGTTSISNLVVNDSTPQQTTFGAASVVTTPSGLGTAVTTTPSAGATGSVRWSFPGTLSPNASGTLQFSVVINP